MAEDNGFAMGYALGQDSNGGNGGNGGFGGSFGEGLWAVIILAILFGRGGFGWGGDNGSSGGSGGSGVMNYGFSPWSAPWATQADVRAAVDQQTLVGKIDGQTYGIADSFTALNNSLNSNFRGIDNAVCTLGYQNQAGINALSSQLAQCCCDTRAAIQENTTQGVMNTNAIQRQISDCCCDIEKMNMQSRFDAQTYNCNTLQAIDKLGDRIIDYMSNEKTQALRDENQALRLRASQADQNNLLRAAIDASTAEIIRRTGNECPIPAYVVPNPNCCYGNPVGVSYGYGFGGYGGHRDNGCGSCC